MLDPSSAIGLAASLITLLNFTKDVLSRSQELQKSINGGLVRNTELQAVMERFGDCILQFKKESHPSVRRVIVGDVAAGFDRNENQADAFENELMQLAEEVGKIINQLMQALEALKSSSPTSRWTCIRQALMTMFKERELVHIEERIDRYRKQIDTTMLAAILSGKPLTDLEVC